MCKTERQDGKGVGNLFVFTHHFVRAQNSNQMFLKGDKLMSESKVFFLGFSLHCNFMLVCISH